MKKISAFFFSLYVKRHINEWKKKLQNKWTSRVRRKGRREIEKKKKEEWNSRDGDYC